MSVYYKKSVNIPDDDIEYIHNNILNVNVNENTVSMDRELFVKMCSVFNKFYNIKVNSDINYEDIITNVIDWIVTNYTSEYTALVKIKDIEYICIKSVNYLRCILNELGYGVCTAEFLKLVPDDKLLRDKGKYSRHGKNLPMSTQKLLNLNSRVVIFTDTSEYVNEYKKLCNNNKEHLYGLERQ